MVQVFRIGQFDENGMLREKPFEEARPGLYFFSAASVSLIKIGYVRKIKRVMHRLHALQPGCPYRLSLLFVLADADRLDESRLHKLFAEYNHEREWFRCEGALKGFLQLAMACPEEAELQMQEYLLKQKRLT